ncbi:hypothetical protein GCM10010470_32790 [Saccharopolyspora taberi]|uniref:Uncharacterized protein n=1 Tax=Saccharopolyspora taberi TaxID=60895 RepID=A0ABN3VEF8_9PSEU
MHIDVGAEVERVAPAGEIRFDPDHVPAHIDFVDGADPLHHEIAECRLAAGLEDQMFAGDGDEDPRDARADRWPPLEELQRPQALFGDDRYEQPHRRGWEIGHRFDGWLFDRKVGLVLRQLLFVFVHGFS